MRCKNCGWPNKPNVTICVKCGSPLDAEPQVMENNGNSGNYQPQGMGDSGDGLKKTVMENSVFGPSVEQPHPEAPNVSESSCPKCGYPMRAGAAKCPNCNYSPSASVNPQPNNHSGNAGGEYQRHPTRMAQEPEEPVLKQTRKVSPEGGPYRGTINPYMMNYQAEPAFILQPIQRMNERKPVETAEFEGSEIKLNRDNTEPGNPTISSKSQAVIIHQDGHWFIVDQSEQKTTFVQAAQRTELHDGDIILLGNRLFEFKEQ